MSLVDVWSLFIEWDITVETLRSCHHLVSATHLKTYVENLCGINTITEVYNVIKKFLNNYISIFKTIIFLYSHKLGA